MQLSHKKFKSHRKHSIDFFVNINPKISLRDSLRTRIQDQLTWIVLDDDESKDMTYTDKTTEEKNNYSSIRPLQQKVDTVNQWC